MPRRTRRCVGSPVMSASSKRTRPAVGRSTPVSRLNNVVLPAPLGPISPRISPALTESVTLFTATSPPKRQVSPDASSNAISGLAIHAERLRACGQRAPATARLVGGVGPRDALRHQPHRQDQDQPEGEQLILA